MLKAIAHKKANANTVSQAMDLLLLQAEDKLNSNHRNPAH